ncbi:MAG: PTS sugar transporter subunit IIB [Atopobium sp.]|uniref:PTS sugar transporter subunit IIB n=1 Tax=Atopobium sp. TaxID=1872650 RepID=UPI002A80DAD7|nr:PTS sugar transporter subunit IIB [Atopobium sp.]MDY4522772.1 PTS sugar transporter subunit IIB [Atopobium sp.]
MKNIILACGSGVATSTAVAAKIKDLLDSNGLAGTFTITTCSISEAVGKSKDADLLIATTVKPDGIECPFISGIPFLTGMGRAAAEQQVVDFIKN